MWFLNASTQKLENFADRENPKYAILSYALGVESVSYSDIMSNTALTKEDYAIIQLACSQVLKDGLAYLWIESCCLDGSNNGDLSEFINSSYQWYRQASVCYVCLADIPEHVFHGSTNKAYPRADHCTRMYEALISSHWFLPAWTLQELIAPKLVEFFNAKWDHLGNRADMAEMLSKITGIDAVVLRNRDTLSTFSAAAKMSWAAHRSSTRVEDQAYALLGLFDISMPILYGEGSEAFTRLQKEILHVSGDQTILLWEPWEESHKFLRFSPSPYGFRNAQRVMRAMPLGLERGPRLPSQGASDLTQFRRCSRFSSTSIIRNNAVRDSTRPSSIALSGHSTVFTSDVAPYQTPPSSAPEGTDGSKAEAVIKSTDDRANESAPRATTYLVSKFVAKLVLEMDLKSEITDLSAIDSTITDLLVWFSILLKRRASEEVHVEAAFFIRHQRKAVQERFRQSLTDQSRELGDQANPTLTEKMSLWWSHMAESQSCLNRTADLEELTVIGSPPSSLSSDCGEESLVPRDVPAAKEFLLQSPEFMWLLEQVNVATRMTQTGPTFFSVRKAVIDALEDHPVAKGFQLSLSWDIEKFFHGQFPTRDKHLESVIVYNGEPDRAWATTVAEYCQWLWPEVASHVIACLQQVIDAPQLSHSCTFLNTNMAVSLYDGMTHVNIHGDGRIILAVSEVCIWLAISCRVNEGAEQVGLSWPDIRSFDGHLQMHAVLQLDLGKDRHRHADGLCWTQMVRNPILAKGYPIPHRQSEIGLEISSPLMVRLSHASELSAFCGVFLLKGLVSALVPVSQVGISILWHLLVNSNGSRMSYNDACKVPSQIEHFDSSMLDSRRHFIGHWSPSVQIMAGSPHVPCKVGLTINTLRRKGAFATLRTVNISAGKIVGVGAAFDVGRKDQAAVFDTIEKHFNFVVQEASKMNVAFYGQEDRRAWMLDGASALLHLSRLFLESESAEAAEKGILEKLHDLTGQNCGKKAAREALRRNADIVIFKNSLLKDDEADAAKGHFTYEQLIRLQFRNLEKLCDYFTNLRTPGTEVRAPHFGTILTGFEVKDFISGVPQIYPKEIKLQHHHSSRWIDLLKELDYTTVLIGRTFGSLIQPSNHDRENAFEYCPRYGAVPCWEDLLVVPFYLLEAWSEGWVDHKRRNVLRITENIYWRGFDGFPKETQPFTCTCASPDKCYIISTLGSKMDFFAASENVRMKDALSFSAGAAVIGGPRTIHKRDHKRIKLYREIQSHAKTPDDFAERSVSENLSSVAGSNSHEDVSSVSSAVLTSQLLDSSVNREYGHEMSTMATTLSDVSAEDFKARVEGRINAHQSNAETYLHNRSKSFGKSTLLPVPGVTDLFHHNPVPAAGQATNSAGERPVSAPLPHPLRRRSSSFASMRDGNILEDLEKRTPGWTEHGTLGGLPGMISASSYIAPDPALFHIGPWPGAALEALSASSNVKDLERTSRPTSVLSRPPSPQASFSRYLSRHTQETSTRDSTSQWKRWIKSLPSRLRRNGSIFAKTVPQKDLRPQVEDDPVRVQAGSASVTPRRKLRHSLFKRGSPVDNKK